MNVRKGLTFATIGLIVLIVSVVLALPESGNGQSRPATETELGSSIHALPISRQKDVTVVNTVNQPIPVQGNMIILNSPSNPIPIRNVDFVAPKCLEFSLDLSFTTELGTKLLYTVPTGKKLVLDFAAVELLVPKGQTGSIRILEVVPGPPYHNLRQPIALFPQGLSDQDRLQEFAGTHYMHTCVEAGSELWLEAFKSSAVGDGISIGTLSATLTDAP